MDKVPKYVLGANFVSFFIRLLTTVQSQPATGRALIRANSREFDSQQKNKCQPLASDLAQLIQDRLDLENGWILPHLLSCVNSFRNETSPTSLSIPS